MTAEELRDRAQGLIDLIGPGSLSATAVEAQVQAIAEELIKQGYLEIALDLLEQVEDALADAEIGIAEKGFDPKKTQDLLQRIRDLIAELARQLGRGE